MHLSIFEQHSHWLWVSWLILEKVLSSHITLQAKLQYNLSNLLYPVFLPISGRFRNRSFVLFLSHIILFRYLVFAHLCITITDYVYFAFLKYCILILKYYSLKRNVLKWFMNLQKCGHDKISSSIAFFSAIWGTCNLIFLNTQMRLNL